MIKFSIIVPIYNVEEYLPKCLDSLVYQSFRDIEIICVNDGSKDNSLQILQEYAKKDNRIKIINQENQGVSVARNLGIDNAKGNYILFVDADDWIDIKTCEIIFKSLSEKPDLVSFNAVFINNHKLHFGLNKNISTIINSEMWSICYNKDFLNHYNIRFPENIKIAEDHIFKLQTLNFTQNIKILGDYLYYYLQDRENSSCNDKNIISNNIKAFYFTIKQVWFVNSSIEKQSNMIDFWTKLIGGTLLKIGFNDVDSKLIKDYITFIKHLDNYSEYKLKNLIFLNLFLILKSLHIFDIYRNIIRQFIKYCIILPYRKMKLYRVKNEVSFE